jgi:transposase-like protein
MARHRIHSLAFKKQVVQEYAAGATLNGLAREYDLSRNLIRIWIAKCESGEFDPGLLRRRASAKNARAMAAIVPHATSKAASTTLIATPSHN